MDKDSEIYRLEPTKSRDQVKFKIWQFFFEGQHDTLTIVYNSVGDANIGRYIRIILYLKWKYA